MVKDIPDFVDHIIVVDDCCPEESYREVSKAAKVTTVLNPINKGVGGAVLEGYKKALELNADVIIKIDGDGQMDPTQIERLITPLINNVADYTKANRFRDFRALKNMPKVRLFGNSFLSFVVKFCSGYWHVMDPTNGFTAIKKEALEGLKLSDIAQRYFFEIDMLINLNIENRRVVDIPMPAKYGDETSSLSILKVLFSFPGKILKGFTKRIFYKYYIYDFNMASIYILTGIPLLFFGLAYGSYHWIQSFYHSLLTPPGTIMLSAVSILLGVQFLLQAIGIDIDNNSRR